MQLPPPLEQLGLIELEHPRRRRPARFRDREGPDVEPPRLLAAVDAAEGPG